MNWGAGPALGLLTALGYVVFAIGAALAWRNRSALSIWAHDEIGLLRRSFSRYTAIGPFYGVREGSRLKSIPAQFAGSLRRFPRHRVHAALVLIFLGAILFVLDFFI